MRRNIFAMITLVLLIGFADAQIRDSSHEQMECVVCHTPTVGTAEVGEWESERSFGERPTTANSALCTTCHEGITSGGFQKPAGSNLLMVGHHLNVPYDLNRYGLATTRFMGDHWQFEGNKFNPESRLKLVSADESNSMPTVQCITCHDPHGRRGNHLLRDPYESGYQSRFCVTCHRGIADGEA